MDLFRNEELNALIFDKDDQLRISLYLPVHRYGYEQQQDPVRLKNLLDDVEKRLIGESIRLPEALSVLEAGRNLLADADFWQHQSDGLALFISRDQTRTYRLPVAFDELIYVSHKYYIKPLLPLLSGDGEYFILAISLNDIRLFQGTRYTVEAVDLRDIPTSISEALRFDDQKRQLQLHTTALSAQGSSGQGVFHGHNELNRYKQRILRYFHSVDQDLVKILGNDNRPLVLAGVDFLLPIYQEANSYPHLIAEGIEGNPEELSPKELHRRAWQIVGPIFQTSEQEAIERYRKLAGMKSSEVSNDLQEVFEAAVHGRVDTLFVVLGRQRWGSYRLRLNHIHQFQVHEKFQPGDEDLLNGAATYTLKNGGSVYGRAVGNVPGNGELAAIFRYSYKR